MATSFDKALQEAQKSWMDLEGVESVGQGDKDGQPCIRVFISMRTDEVRDQIPSSFRGHPVDVVESGVISAGG